MRPALVLDASVAVKWVLPENGRAEAVQIRQDFQDERIDVIAPYLIVAEVGNVLWKRKQRGELPAQAAQVCFQEFLRNCPILVDSAAVTAAALALAMAHRRTIYDCLYLAWSLEQGCDLITADERFFHSMRVAFPRIRLLKAFKGTR